MNQLQVKRLTAAMGYNRLCERVKQWRNYHDVAVTADGRIFAAKKDTFRQLADEDVFDFLLWIDNEL